MIKRSVPPDLARGRCLATELIPAHDRVLLHLTPRRVVSVARCEVMTDGHASAFGEAVLAVTLIPVDDLTTAMQIVADGHELISDHPLCFVWMEHHWLDWRSAFRVVNNLSVVLVDGQGVIQAAQTLGMTPEFVAAIHGERLRQNPLVFAYDGFELDRIEREHVARLNGRPLTGGLTFPVSNALTLAAGAV